jgi:murein DD-endopeptidase MepM/ murein hydrolase activator NlpD
MGRQWQSFAFMLLAAFIALVPLSAPAQAPPVRPFLILPLACGDPDCRARYEHPYTPGIMDSILDHSMARDRSGAWPFGRMSDGGGDGVVIAFNGENARGRSRNANETCIAGAIMLRPDHTPEPMTNTAACGANSTSHDEHPGYDYRAALGTPVRAAASGQVLNLDGQPCYRGNLGGDCARWGYVGIDHGNGYVTQYGHLSRVDVAPGQVVSRGQAIGLSGHTAPVRVRDHLHFEVLRRIRDDYLVVDPYGWVGSGADPLYSARTVPPRNLWTSETSYDELAIAEAAPAVGTPAQLPPIAMADPSGPRVALVIGVSRYGTLGSLINPANDARALATALRRLRFDVDLIVDPDQRAMKQAITRLGERMSRSGSGTTGLFFFAGHGIQSRGINYLIPAGANIHREADLDLEAVAADTVLLPMQEAGVSTNIVILDACRNMPLTRSFRSGAQGLAQMQAPNGTFIAYSTAPGAVAADGTGANSPFATALLREMVVPGQTIEAVFRNVRRSVLRDTRGEQRPWDSSSLIDPFVFRP